MSFRLFLLLIFVICRPALGYSQSSSDALIEQVIEYIAENVDEDRDYSEITERLNFYRKNPVNVNLVSKEQLQELVFISPVQINALISHRQENGPFADLLELQSLPGFDVETVKWLSNFVALGQPDLLTGVTFTNLVKKSSHDLMIRFGKILEPQSGFLPSAALEEPAYSGSGLKVFTRYRYNYANAITASLNMEKDAGEGFLKGQKQAFDFYSGNVSFKGKRFVRKLVLGDYSLQFGQGLAMWSGLGFGKGAGLITIAKQDIGLRPYSSVNESSFLRGISGTVQAGKISFTPFFSYRDLDATVSDNGGEIKSISISGLHRTSTEIKNKNLLNQMLYGINSEYSGKSITFGLTAYRTEFSMPFGAGNSLYQQYDFTGSSLTNLGFHYNYTYRNSYLFGEAAHSISSGSAFINGLMTSLSNQVSLVMLYRNYARNYHSFFNQGISEATDAVNETGFYSGLVIKFNPKWELVTYSDFFNFAWLKFRVNAPSKGHEMFAQLTYSLNKRFKVSGRFKYQLKEENAEDLSNSDGLEGVDKKNYRVELVYKLNDNFSIRNRAEFTAYKKEHYPTEFGFLSYQDLIYDPMSSKFSGNVRFAIFDTQSFNSRIYAYENDVLYGYSVPGYQGRGLKCYVNGRYTLRRGVDIWLRYGVLSYADQATVGSGNDMISGNQRSDVRIQLRYQF
jgi:hypothetical protein